MSRRGSKGLIHAIGECKVCDAHWEDYRTARQQAAKHAKKLGHRVIVDLGYVVEYEGVKKVT